MARFKLAALRKPANACGKGGVLPEEGIKIRAQKGEKFGLCLSHRAGGVRFVLQKGHFSEQIARSQMRHFPPQGQPAADPDDDFPLVNDVESVRRIPFLKDRFALVETIEPNAGED